MAGACPPFREQPDPRMNPANVKGGPSITPLQARNVPRKSNTCDEMSEVARPALTGTRREGVVDR